VLMATTDLTPHSSTLAPPTSPLHPRPSIQFRLDWEDVEHYNSYTVPEEVSDRFGVFGNALVGPAGQPVVLHTADFLCVQVAQLQYCGYMILQGGCGNDCYLETAILFGPLGRPVACTLLLCRQNMHSQTE